MGLKILIIDDDPDIRDVMNITLSEAGYDCIEAGDGEEGLKAIREQNPDLVLVDYKMPRVTGPEVCRQVKSDILLRHLPIIMVTGKGELSDKVNSIDSGADDYIVKPFEPKELLARIRMVLRRTRIDQEANPLTRLPGNISISNEISRQIENKKPFAVCYTDLNNFKAYNDKYGVEYGDKVIKKTGDILIGAVRTLGNPVDFIGHVGGDDFVIVTTPDVAEKICLKIIDDFDAAAPSFYKKTDRENGFIVAKDRQGIERKMPIMTISIGIVTNELRELENPIQVAAIGTELNHYAKTFDKSYYAKDLRKI